MGGGVGGNAPSVNAGMDGVIGGNRPPVIGDNGPPPGVNGKDGGGIEMREGCSRNPCGGPTAAVETVVEEALDEGAGGASALTSGSGSGSAQPLSRYPSLDKTPESCILSLSDSLARPFVSSEAWFGSASASADVTCDCNAPA